MNYASLHEFTDFGLAAFQKVFTGQLAENAIGASDPAVAKRIDGTGPFSTGPFATAKGLAAAVFDARGSHTIAELVPRTGLWAWLTFILRDDLFPVDSNGRRKFGEVHRWYPSNPNDWQKGQRHLVRMPVLLLSSLEKNADHLLCGSPATLPEIREQLTSQQDMFHPAFQGAARLLYYDDGHQRLKTGAGGKAAGSPRRLAKVRQQLDVTWDLYDLSAEKLVGLLPKEFDRFKKRDRSESAGVSAQTPVPAEVATT